jgi:hypothetical protein
MSGCGCNGSASMPIMGVRGAGVSGMREDLLASPAPAAIAAAAMGTGAIGGAVVGGLASGTWTGALTGGLIAAAIQGVGWGAGLMSTGAMVRSEGTNPAPLYIGGAAILAAGAAAAYFGGSRAYRSIKARRPSR